MEFYVGSIGFGSRQVRSQFRQSVLRRGNPICRVINADDPSLSKGDEPLDRSFCLNDLPRKCCAIAPGSRSEPSCFGHILFDIGRDSCRILEQLLQSIHDRRLNPAQQEFARVLTYTALGDARAAHPAPTSIGVGNRHSTAANATAEEAGEQVPFVWSTHAGAGEICAIPLATLHLLEEIFRYNRQVWDLSPLPFAFRVAPRNSFPRVGIAHHAHTVPDRTTGVEWVHQ
ncbi:MAG TPA: hypothetical protein VMP03_00980 [Methylomirabilota bacterium]|nr:hypothetical protein [Methylomirabilota bacterium]